jgi:hypothetical protein
MNNQQVQDLLGKQSYYNCPIIDPALPLVINTGEDLYVAAHFESICHRLVFRLPARQTIPD